MMRIAKYPPATPLPLEPAWAEVQIAVELGEGSYLLDDGRVAQQAASCLLTPAVGDRVLVVGCRQSENYITHLLHRASDDTAYLSVPGATQMTIRQASISLSATEQIAVHSLRDVEVIAATGVLSLTARNLFTTVTESLVENIRHYVGTVEQYLLDVKKLLRLHGKQASITAEQDVKIDADRISMG
jgi:hypothetical protein